MKDLLDIKNLAVSFHNNETEIKAVKDVSFTLKKGEFLGIVGESGSGKSLTALSILGLLPYPKAYHSKQTSIKYNGIELINNHNIRFIRGSKIGFIFQEPMSALNPLHTIGKQIAETLIIHQKLSLTEALHKSKELLELTGIKNAKKRLSSYPHELSGGQRQRVMIAMAIANKPDILIADEPTTALDVTIQKQIIDLIKELQQKMQLSVIFISHDLRLIKRVADRVIVMKDGKIVEQGNTDKIFNSPQHSYTKTLISSIIDLKKNNKNKSDVLLNVKDLMVQYPQKTSLWKKNSGCFTAVDKVSFFLKKGETLGIVGESGSGKTTLGMALCNLIKHEGSIQFSNISAAAFHKDIQIVFQDPFTSLNPRMNVEQIVGEGLDVHFKNISKNDKKQKITKILKEVGLAADVLEKYPHEFSGGQRQRIAIARALVIEPQLVILDEPTSALDVTVQKQILSLLKEIQEKKGLSYIFISHDLHAVADIADRIAVMENGKIVEQGPTSEIINNPQKPYTIKLLEAFQE